MREIKFRAKSVISEEWFFGGGVQQTGESWATLSIDADGHLVVHRVQPETIGQSTCLKDKNGKEIFENDIVIKSEYMWMDEGKPNYRGTVEWIYSQWQVVAHCVNSKKKGISDGINQGLNDDGVDEGEMSAWEVIGNIYENPELLEKVTP